MTTVRPPARMQLDLSLAGGQLRATVERSEGARSPVRVAARRPFDEGRVRALHEEMIALLGRATRWGDLDPGGAHLLRRHGQLLFDQVLPAPIKDAIREATPCELALVLDDTLVFVPWEWMHTGERFLGLDCALGRLVRTERPLPRPSAPRTPGSRRMLVLCDPRGDLLGSYYEGVTLRDRLDGEGERLVVDLRSTEVDAREIKGLIREYDVIHYAGHAEAWPDRPADSGWLVHGGVLSASEILDMAGGRPFPELVFANACRSGRVEGALPPTDTGEGVYSLASAFLLAGVGHYVGTLWDVPDEAACHFSLAFYEALLSGATYGEAMGHGRAELCERYGADTVLRAAWVLYGDPSVRCFPDRRSGRRPASARHTPPRKRPAGARRPPGPHGRTARPVVTRGHALAARRPRSADPPFELAGAGQRRLLWALTLCTAVTLSALLTLLAIRTPTGSATHLEPMGLLPEGSAPEMFPAPRPPSPPGTPAAAAEPAEDESGREPILEAVVQPRSATGDPDDPITVRDGGALHSWDNFRIRFHLDRPARATLWHVESQGAIQRIHPDPDAEVEAASASAGWTVLPDAERWYYLDDRRGTELFVLGLGPKSEEDEAWEEELRALEQALTRARKAQASSGSSDEGTAAVLRGIGGTYAPTRGDAAKRDGRILDQVLTALRQRYEAVRVMRLEHR